MSRDIEGRTDSPFPLSPEPRGRKMGAVEDTRLACPLCDVRLATDPFVVVHQAIGMTMEYLNCSGMEAFVEITGRANETGQDLLNVAADLVERRFRFRPTQG